MKAEAIARSGSGSGSAIMTSLATSWFYACSCNLDGIYAERGRELGGKVGDVNYFHWKIF
jgi:hypothetical protein